MTKEEWLQRYKARLIEVAGLTDEQGRDCADAVVVYDTQSQGSPCLHDDPEQSADDELSYWDDDGE